MEIPSPQELSFPGMRDILPKIIDHLIENYRLEKRGSAGDFYLPKELSLEAVKGIITLLGRAGWNADYFQDSSTGKEWLAISAR